LAVHVAREFHLGVANVAAADLEHHILAGGEAGQQNLNIQFHLPASFSVRNCLIQNNLVLAQFAFRGGLIHREEILFLPVGIRNQRHVRPV
jgi:hypothetical protein